MSLFPVKESIPGLPGWERVENNERWVKIFEGLYSRQTDVLYNHSRIFPFSYLNKGRLKLFVNKTAAEGNIIPIVQQNEHTPYFSIHCPEAPGLSILEVVQFLDGISSAPVEITDLTLETAKHLENALPGGWRKVKTSDDVMQDAEELAHLKGRAFSSLRNTLKHVREDLRPVTVPIILTNMKDAIRVFEEWKKLQGAKYFRVTVGRDIRLIEEYGDKVDMRNFFGYVHYVNDHPSACSFGCRSFKDPVFGVDVTVKARIDCKGLSDYAFIHLIQQMYQCGILLVNDSGYYGKGIKANKLKFAPAGTVPMYNIRRK